MKDFIERSINVFCRLSLVGAFILIGSLTAVSAQQLFSSPDDALKSLSAAVTAKDHTALETIFGPRLRDIVTGDTVADKNEFDEFAANLKRSAKLERVNVNTFTVLIGEDDWPFAAPIVKQGGQWKFDTDAGVEELIARRIGMNEMAASLVCEEYAIAQYEYFNGDDHDGDQVSEYAQKIASSPGKRDGLFWEMADGDEEASPLGPLFAYASIEGYKPNKGTVQTVAPFHGYYYKVLFGQGASAPGGKFGYIINGNMIAGFALVAYPSDWGKSGIMTFMVNQEGRVYQKNLGPRTAAIASAMTLYDPDVSWELVDAN